MIGQKCDLDRFSSNSPDVDIDLKNLPDTLVINFSSKKYELSSHIVGRFSDNSGAKSRIHL